MSLGVKMASAASAASAAAATTSSAASAAAAPLKQALHGKHYFVQSAPRVSTAYDSYMAALLRRHLPAAVHADVEADVRAFGRRCAGEVAALGVEAERQPPTLEQYNGFGQRTDVVHVSSAWQRLLATSAEEGLLALAYERRHGPWSRMHQWSKVMLFGPVCAVATCPLAMADGAARLCELTADRRLEPALRRLTSRNAAVAWTSGQWMTERTGGSDIAHGETTAVALGGDEYALYGFKFFTSAITSEMAFTLARIVDPATGTAPSGSRGLSLFYVETRTRDSGELNALHVHKLKVKLGTRALPTAELELNGTRATLIGDVGRGVPLIATMLQVTRVWSALHGAAYFRRALTIAKEHARVRSAFGSTLAEKPLHVATLAALEVEVRGQFQLIYEVFRLTGHDEVGDDGGGGGGGLHGDDALMLRLLSPLAKMFIAKRANAGVAECMEALGGQGYMEDATNIPAMFRDQHVNSIWEGTTNVLALDMLRALAKQPHTLDAFARTIAAKLSAARSHVRLAAVAERYDAALRTIGTYARRMATDGAEFTEAGARDFGMSLASVYAGALLVEHAVWSADDAADLHTAEEWSTRHVTLPRAHDDATRAIERELVFAAKL